MGFISIYKITLCLGFFLLLHAAYSSAQHRTYLRITEQEFKSLPIDVTLQAIAGLGVLIFSILQIVGNLKEIRTVQNKSWETLSNLSSFYHFQHRGKALYGQEYLQPFFEDTKANE